MVHRDVVQPLVFVTVTLRENKKNPLALTWSLVGQSLLQVYNPVKHKICALPITPNVTVGPTLLIWKWILAFCLCNPLCFLLYNVERILPLTLVAALSSSLPGNTRYWLPGDCTNILLFLFSIPSSLDKELNEKPMFVHVGLFSTPNLSSGTALQQNLQFTSLNSCWWTFWQQSTLPNSFHSQWSCLKSILLIS